MTEPIKNYVILGGGTAGWMTAAALSRFLQGVATITLVESEVIGTVGVGEATIPHLRVFNDMLGIDEHEFMLATQATYKLGIHFRGWGGERSDYYHPFGIHGFDIDGVPFHHYWLKARNEAGIEPFDRFSLANVMAMKKRFVYPTDDPHSVESTYSYAYHLDAGAYARLLRKYSEEKGVKRIEGKVENIERCRESGFIQALQLDNGDKLEGDFFIDCSGFRSLMLGEVLGVQFESWKHWLPCDSALAAPSTSEEGDINPYTQSNAQRAGWCWHIPLQNRMGNGYVYSSDYESLDQAMACLEADSKGEFQAEPRQIKFEAGMRSKAWHKNCVGIGLSSGFLEPLESTSIYLIQVGIYKLLEMLPVKGDHAIEEAEYNRLVDNEYRKIRDFIILHYYLNDRPEEFWRYCAHMNIPDSLSEKVELYISSAKVMEYESGLFMPPSWLAVYIGQGKFPESIDYRAECQDIDVMTRQLKKMSQYLQWIAEQYPAHAQSLRGLGKGKRNNVAPTMSLYGLR